MKWRCCKAIASGEYCMFVSIYCFFCVVELLQKRRLEVVFFGDTSMQNFCKISENVICIVAEFIYQEIQQKESNYRVKKHACRYWHKRMFHFELQAGCLSAYSSTLVIAQVLLMIQNYLETNSKKFSHFWVIWGFEVSRKRQIERGSAGVKITAVFSFVPLLRAVGEHTYSYCSLRNLSPVPISTKPKRVRCFAAQYNRSEKLQTKSVRNVQ